MAIELEHKTVNKTELLEVFDLTVKGGTQQRTTTKRKRSDDVEDNKKLCEAIGLRLDAHNKVMSIEPRSIAAKSNLMNIGDMLVVRHANQNGIATTTLRFWRVLRHFRRASLSKNNAPTPQQMKELQVEEKRPVEAVKDFAQNVLQSIGSWMAKMNAPSLISSPGAASVDAPNPKRSRLVVPAPSAAPLKTNDTRRSARQHSSRNARVES